MAQSTIRLSSISTRLVLQAIIGSLRPSTSYECERCGSSITAQRMDGTSGSVSIVVTHGPMLSSLRSKHVAALTSDGNVSISCECERYERIVPRDSGGNDGTSYISGSSEALEHWARNIETLVSLLGSVCLKKETGIVFVSSLIHARIVVEQFLEDLARDGERETETYVLLERVHLALAMFLDLHLAESGIVAELKTVN